VRRLPWALLLLPALQGFWYVHCYGVNLVWIDQWDGLAPLFEKWFAGTLCFGDFCVQHNEHRCLVPELLMFGLGLLTRWNTVAEMYATEVVLALLLTIVGGVFLRDCPAKSRLWLMLPIGFLVFSLRQNENMLWGWQFGFVLVAAEAAASLACLSWLNYPGRHAWKYFGALLFATGATFSSAQGLMVWPVGLLPLLLAPLGKKRKALFVAGWMAAAVVELSVYFCCGYTRPPGLRKLMFSFEYFATIMGGSLFNAVPAAMAAGVIVLLLSAAVLVLVYKEGQWRRHSFWLAMLVLGLLIQLQVTLGRSHLDLRQALSSRYSTSSLFLVIATYAILSNLNRKRRGRLIFGLWGLSLSMIVVGITASTVDGYQAGVTKRQKTDYWAFMVYTCDTQPDKIFNTSENVNASLIRRTTSFLREHRWNVFASPELDARYAIPRADLPKLSVPAHLQLSHFGPEEDFPAVVTISGWAVDADKKNLIGGVFLDLDGVLYPTYYGWRRDDAVEALGNQSLRCCGFLRFFPNEWFSAGRHVVTFKVLTKNRTAFFKSPDPMYLDIKR
jgi:hypothetical protein